ncbi:MAG: DUF1549 domain-containing protein [Richelia sp. CSU_2_1]|nr:DUF1549 domain-containing protein [Richelia sp. CSU_2_1]
MLEPDRLAEIVGDCEARGTCGFDYTLTLEADQWMRLAAPLHIPADAVSPAAAFQMNAYENVVNDEVAPERDDIAVATGYLVRNWYALNPNEWMRANVEHTGRAFLGLSFQCAHCHDHGAGARRGRRSSSAG